MYDVIVVGGGASGMMAAGRAAQAGKKVLLIEKNKRLGEKLRITGGGRCNITNAEPDQHALLAHYGDAADFLYSPFSQFGVAATRTFFDNLGVPTVEQGGRRVFPRSELAEDVAEALERHIRAVGVTIRLGAAVQEILVDAAVNAGSSAGSGATAGAFRRITGIRVQQSGGAGHKPEVLTVTEGGSYIIATGGLSHPETGSTGDGFAWLRKLGHTVKEPTPTIVPLAAPDAWVHALSGTALDDAKITFYREGEKAFSKKGKILFTHFGLSGPLILNSAAEVADLLHAGKVTATIDMFPARNIGELDAFLLATFDAHKNKLFKNVLRECVPAGMAPGVETFLGGSASVLETKVHSITKDMRRALVDAFKAMPLTITGLMGFDKAVVADGGVPLSEIDMKTMRSLRCSNLAITGDLLHINRPSGGFSLQLCWTTGWVAGGGA